MTSAASSTRDMAESFGLWNCFQLRASRNTTTARMSVSMSPDCFFLLATVLFEERERERPGDCGGFWIVVCPCVAEKAVIGIGEINIHVGFLELLESIDDCAFLLVLDVFIKPSPQHKLRSMQIFCFLEQCFSDSPAVKRDGAGERKHFVCEKRCPSAHAETNRSNFFPNLGFEPIVRRPQVCRERFIHNAVAVCSCRLPIRVENFNPNTAAVVEFRRNREVSFAGKTLGNITNMRIHPERLL